MSTMFFGKRFVFIPVSRAYPRYQFFRRKLSKLFPQVRKIFEDNDLVDFVSQGKQTWSSIETDIAECISDSATISICVFASDSSLLTEVRDVLVRDKTVLEQEAIGEQGKKSSKIPRVPVEVVTVEDVGWESVLGIQKSSRYAPQIIVYVKGKQEDADVVEKQMAILSEIQQEHLVIYDITNKKSVLFHSRDPYKDGKGAILFQNIEFLLEENAVAMIERMEEFTNKFVPKPGQVNPDDSVFNQVTDQLEENFKNIHILKDFLPGRADEDRITEILLESKTQTKTENEIKTDILHERLRKNISMLVKCQFCDLTGKRLGIPASFVNRLMSEENFDFRRQYEKGVNYEMLPKWPLLPNIVNDFKSASYRCYTVCKGLFPLAEAYVHKLYLVLRTLKKFQFEMIGLLRRSPRALTTSPPKTVRIPKHLQDALLDLDYVEMCGTLYGTMTVVMNKQPIHQQRKEIWDIVQRHKYKSAYEISIIEAWNEQAPLGPSTAFIEHGNGIVSEFVPGGKEKLIKKLQEEGKPINDFESVRGTLGCFVKPRVGDDLYAVTCYHCVNEEYFDENIKVQLGQVDALHALGSRSPYGLYSSYIIDIALIKVSPTTRNICDKHMVKEDGMNKVSTWTISERDAPSIELEALSVYKVGQTSGLTHGVVIGPDFKIRRMRDLQRNGFLEHCSIFIAGKPHESEATAQVAAATSGQQATQQLPVPMFSKDGDSGSVVCTEILPEDGSQDQETHVEAISLLCGSILLKADGDGNPEEYSYSCLMKSLLDELVIQKNCPPLTAALET